MKKLIALMAGVCLCGSAFAQGTVTFQNNGSTLATILGVNAAVGSATFQLYYQPGTVTSPTAMTIDPSGALLNTTGWEPLGATAGIAPLAGRITAGLRTTGADQTGGNSVWLEVVGWSGTASTYAAALAAGGADVGVSGDWSNPTGNPGGTPPTPAQAMVLGASGFNGINLKPVPEPATLALGGLGAAAMFFLRRKK